MGISALITTFGVGELSALNGIAGAFSERIPVVHIVGCPSTISQRDGMLLHHTLGNGDFSVFANMSAEISCNVAKLNDPQDIANKIDYALQSCFRRSRPVYIMLPTDRIETKIEGARLDKPIDLSEPQNPTEQEDYVVDVVMRYLTAAKHPVILVDACAIRHRVLDEVHDLIDKTKLPVFVTPMGKGAVNESHPNFGGVYAGVGSHPSQVKDIVEASDLILSIGALKVRLALPARSPPRSGHSPDNLTIQSRQTCGSCPDRDFPRATLTRPASPTAPPSSTPSTSTATTASCVTRRIPASV